MAGRLLILWRVTCTASGLLREYTARLECTNTDVVSPSYLRECEIRLRARGES
jgi:hypothetical protein